MNDWPLKPKFGERGIFSGLSEIADLLKRDRLIHEVLSTISNHDFENIIYNLDPEEIPYQQEAKNHVESCEDCYSRRATVGNKPED